MNISFLSLEIMSILGIVMLTGGLAAMIYLVMIPGPDGTGFSLWDKYLATFKPWLNLLASKTKPIEVVGYQLLAIGFLLGLWIVMDVDYAKFAILAVIPLTYPIFKVLYQQRCEAIAKQLDGWLLMLSNMLSATGSVGNAIQSSAALIQSPLKEEIELMLKQIVVGVTIEDALATLYKRVPSVGLYTVVTSLRVGRQLGGDLPSLLAENAATLRESERIDGFIRSAVSAGRAQLVVLGLAPIGMAYGFVKVVPDFFDPLTAHVLGPYIIMGCVVLWLIAMILGYKIMDVDA